MRPRFLQVVFGIGIALPLALAALSAPPLVERTSAQQPNRYLGPNSPLIVDTSGDGAPGSGDGTSSVNRDGSFVSFPNRWDCNRTDGDSSAQLTDQSGGKYTSLTRNSDGGRVQKVTAAGFDNGRATQFVITESFNNQTLRTGSGGLSDGNGDGAYETLGGGGGTVPSFSFGLEYHDVTNDGHPDYVGIPWSQSSLLGATQDCQGGNPAVFAPLADTNSDGIPDSIVPDLDGNGQPDDDLQWSPILVGAAVPTMNTAWLVTLVLLASSLGLFMLRRRASLGTPAA